MAIYSEKNQNPDDNERAFRPAFKAEDVTHNGRGDEEELLNVEYSLPNVDLYVPSGEEHVDASSGWHAVENRFNPDTMQDETTVEKDGVRKVFATAELDAFQIEMHNSINNASQRSLADKAMSLIGAERPQKTRHITIIDPEGNEPPRKITVRHDQ